jgi:hypothetical protein
LVVAVELSQEIERWRLLLLVEVEVGLLMAMTLL